MKKLMLFAFLFPATLLAQPDLQGNYPTQNQPNWKWVQKIDGLRCETITASSLNDKDELFVTGIVENTGGGELHSSNGNSGVIKEENDPLKRYYSRLFVAKYDTFGNLKWHITSTGQEGIHPWCMTTDLEGNVIVGGNFRSTIVLQSKNGKSQTIQAARFSDFQTPGGALNYFIAKYDNNGNLLWTKTGLNNSNSYAKQIKTDKNNNVYVLAYCTSNSISFNDYSLVANADSKNGYVYNFSLLLLKYSPQGTEEWITYGGEMNAQFFTLSDDGLVHVWGLFMSKSKIWNTNGKLYNLPGYDTLQMNELIIDKQGNLIQVVPAFNAMRLFMMHKMVQDKEGNYYALVYAYTGGFRNNDNSYNISFNNKIEKTLEFDYFLVKFDINQNMLWKVKFSGKYSDKPLDITLDISGDPIVSGWYWWQTTIYDAKGKSESNESHQKTILISAFTKNGALKWRAETGTMNHKEYDEFCHLNVSRNNALIICETVSHPFKLGSIEVDIKGQSGWPFSAPNPQNLKVYEFSDACIAMTGRKSVKIDTIKKQKDTILPVINLDTTQQIAVARIPVKGKSFDTVQIYNPPKTDPVINMGDSAKYTLLLFPSPVTRSSRLVNLEIEVSKSSKMNLVITDQNGKIIDRISENIPAGLYKRQINVDTYLPGLYYFTFVIDKIKSVKKLVVL